MNGREMSRGKEPSRGSEVSLKVLKDSLKKDALKVEELEINRFNDFCEQMREYAERDKTTFTQIRNIYSKVRKLNNPKEVVFLRPVLAYVGARNNIKDFTDFLDEIIKEIKEDSDLKNFKEFIKMLVCYKRAYK